MGTFKAFVQKHRVGIDSMWVPSNPNMGADGFGSHMNHYKVTLKLGKKKLTTYFSMGSGLSGAPVAHDVLQSLALDALSAENAGGFLDWARDLGYEWERSCEGVTAKQADEYGMDCAPYFKAKATYKAVLANTEKLRNFLGGDLFRELVFNTGE